MGWGALMRTTIAVTALGLSMVGITIAENVTAAVRKPTDITEQPLTSALKTLADERDFQILYVADTVGDAKSGGVRGDLTVLEALDELLKGTGRTYRVLDEQTVMIAQAEVPASRSESWRKMSTHSESTGAEPIGDTASNRGKAEDAATIETVNVFGTLDNELSVGSKSGLSLRETPKSVTLVTRERIEAQNLTSLVDAMNQTTGVTVANYSPVSNAYFSRGFAVQTIQLDGGAPAFLGGFGSFLTPDTAEFDHVEMLRGVDGMYSGAGEPGGVINLVRKRAKATPAVNVSMSAGSWDSYRGEIDVTGALAQDGRLRGRAVGAYENKSYFYRNAESDKRLGFATIEYDLTPTTLLIAGGTYERRKEDGYTNRGLPRYSNGADLQLGPETSLTPKWSHWYSTTKEMFARAEQSYGTSGVLKLNFTRLEESSDSSYMYAFGAINPLTLTGAQVRAFGDEYSAQQELLDLSASGKFTLFGREHRYTIGTDYSRIDGGGQKLYFLTGYAPFGTTYGAVDLFNFDPNLYPQTAPVLRGLYPVNQQSQNGFYGTIGIQLADPLRLTLGGRYGTFRFDQVYQPVTAATGAFGTPSVTRYDDSKFIPSVALSWEFASDWSAYASYAETYKVQANLLRGPLPGTPLDPITGGGLELGVKGELLGVLNVSAAVYQIVRENQGVQDLAYPPANITGNGSSCCYVQQQDITSEGFDAEISGTVLPGWQMFGGYTYNKHKSEGGTASTVYSSGAYYLDRTPRHMVKLWTTWQLPNALSRWTVNGGVVWQTDTSVSGTVVTDTATNVPFTFTQAGYALLNASVQYRLTDNLTLGLYGDNLLDKTYYRVISNSITDNYYGAPRSFVFTLRGQW
jgi:outer membrane receptor for ferric coprogen and ferric-rhodotorulic acid